MARSFSSPRMASSNMFATLLSSRYIAPTYRADISKRYMRNKGVSTHAEREGGGRLQRGDDGGRLGFGSTMVGPAAIGALLGPARTKRLAARPSAQHTAHK